MLTLAVRRLSTVTATTIGKAKLGGSLIACISQATGQRVRDFRRQPRTIEQRLLRRANWMIHNVNRVCSKADGIRIGGHLGPDGVDCNRAVALKPGVAVKPHDLPILYVIQYPMENLDLSWMEDCWR